MALKESDVLLVIDVQNGWRARRASG